MAIEKSGETCKMILKVKAGVNSKGVADFRQRTFNHVKASASDSDVFDVANQLASLQTEETAGVLRQNQATLISK